MQCCYNSWVWWKTQVTCKLELRYHSFTPKPTNHIYCVCITEQSEIQYLPSKVKVFKVHAQKTNKKPGHRLFSTADYINSAFI